MAEHEHDRRAKRRPYRPPAAPAVDDESVDALRTWLAGVIFGVLVNLDGPLPDRALSVEALALDERPLPALQVTCGDVRLIVHIDAGMP